MGPRYRLIDHRLDLFLNQKTIGDKLEAFQDSANKRKYVVLSQNPLIKAVTTELEAIDYMQTVRVTLSEGMLHSAVILHLNDPSYVTDEIMLADFERLIDELIEVFTQISETNTEIPAGWW